MFGKTLIQQNNQKASSNISSQQEVFSHTEPWHSYLLLSEITQRLHNEVPMVGLIRNLISPDRHHLLYRNISISWGEVRLEWFTNPKGVSFGGGL